MSPERVLIQEVNPGDLDSVHLYIRDISQFPVETSQHPKLGAKIFVGQLAINALVEIQSLDWVKADQSGLIGRLLKNESVKFLKDHFDHSLTHRKRLRDKGKVRSPADLEFIRIAESHKKWVGNQLDGLVNTQDREQWLRNFTLRQVFLAQQGLEAHKKLVETNLSLGFFMAAKYQGRSLSLGALASAANVGLMIAAAKYYFKNGAEFSTYAFPWIRQYILQELDENRSIVFLPRNIREELKRFKKAKACFTQKLGREPSSEEMVEEFGEISEKISCALRAQEVISLDRPSSVRGEEEFGDSIPDNAQDPEETAESNEVREAVRKVLGNGQLSDQEREVLILRFGIRDERAKTHEEVGEEFNLSRARIQQVEAGALKKLRQRAGWLRQYLPDDLKGSPITPAEAVWGGKMFKRWGRKPQKAQAASAR